MINLESTIRKIKLTGMIGPLLYLPWHWAMPILYPGTWNPFLPRFSVCLLMWGLVLYIWKKPNEYKKIVLLHDALFFFMVLHHFSMAFANSDAIVYRYTFFLITVMAGALIHSMRTYFGLVALTLFCKLILVLDNPADIKFEIFEFVLWAFQFIVIGIMINSIFKGQNEIDQLSKKTAEDAIAIEKQKALKLQVDKVLLERDLELAGAVQALFLPKINKITSGPIEVCSYFKPASTAGGDWWWFSEVSEHRCRFFIGDVTGHGVGSAMVTAMFSGCYQTVSLMDKSASMEDVIHVLNNMLLKTCGHQYWMTLTAVEIDAKNNKIRLWNLGSPEIFLINENKTESVFGPELSSPLGSGELNFSQVERDFKPGDQFMIFTDGMYEFLDSKNKEFGTLRLRKLFSKSAEKKDLQDQVDFVVRTVENSMPTLELKDDMTFAIVRYNQGEILKQIA